MTTKINREVNTMSTVNSANLVPALGEVWAHSANLRILLSWRGSRRCATICKSSSLPDASTTYVISVKAILCFN
jgi:hypothetical protein